MLSQGSCAVAQVLPKVCDHICPPSSSKHDQFLPDGALHAPQFASQRFVVNQLRQCRAISFIWRRAPGERLRVVIRKMLREFLNDLNLARRRKLQARQPPSDFFFPLRHGLLTVSLDGSWLFSVFHFTPQALYFRRQAPAQFEATGEV